LVPAVLRNGPFTLAEARAAGLTQECLRSKSWRRLGQGLYCWRAWDEEPWQLLAAWQRMLPSKALFAGATAAWLWGIGPFPSTQIEVILPPNSSVRSRAGLHVRRCVIDTGDVARVRGIRVTTLARTLCDLCARLSAVDALVACDMALRNRHPNPFATTQARLPGIGRLRKLAALSAPAESLMETRLRWLLLRAGLPRPAVQSDLRDLDGRFVGRADLYYSSARLVIEYDGANHRDRLIDDDRRQNLLVSAGFRLLRFTAPDLDWPDLVVSQVRRALHESPVWRQSGLIARGLDRFGVRPVESAAPNAAFPSQPAHRPE